MTLKVAVITGTRPEMIKVSVLLRLIEQDPQLELLFIHSGQHYDANMFQIFIDELQLPRPKYNINVGSHPNSIQTGKMLINFYDIISEEKPDIILAQGDTNTVFAAALTAFKNAIPFGHIEAGIRSFDMRMPEEINRMLTGECSLLNFAPTKRAVINLMNEGITVDRIFLTGNPIVDAVQQNRVLAKNKSKISQKLGIQEEKYCVLTMHRAANVDNKQLLEPFLKTFADLSDIRVIFPIHPRTKRNIKKFNLYNFLESSPHIQVIEPVGYLDMLQLMENAYLIITDSGGLQEEAVVLKKPVLTLRENTERPESVEVGANILIGSSATKLKKYLLKLWKDKNFYQSMIPEMNPFGDGTTSQQIIDIIKAKAQENNFEIPYLTYSEQIPNYKLVKITDQFQGYSVIKFQKEQKCKLIEMFDHKGIPQVFQKNTVLQEGYFVKGLFLEEFKKSRMKK